MSFRFLTNLPDPANQGVPLVVWGYTTALTVVLLQAAIWLMVRGTPPPEEFLIYNSARLQRLQEKISAGEIGLVILGDSRARYAIDDDARFSRRLMALLDSPVQVVRITANWAVFDDFEPLVEEVLGSNPRLLLLQEELLAKERARPARLLLGREYLLWLGFGRGPWNPGGLDQHDLQHEMGCDALADEDVFARKERVFRWVKFEPQGNNSRLVREFAARARRRGIAVRFFAVPITSIGRAVLPTFGGDDPLDSLLTPIQIPDSSFCDPVHMNPQGREVYSSWLSQEIAGLLQEAKD